MKISKIIISFTLLGILFLGGITVQAVNVVQVPAKEVQGVYNQSVDSNAIPGWA